MTKDGLHWMPFGWFQVGYANDFEVGASIPLEYLGRQLVAWRDLDETLHVADAYCPHLGAHLGYGGRVLGSCLQCPFHGWEFGPDGRCARVPYSRHLPAVGLRMYPVAQLGDLCFAWFHSDLTVQPLWELPRLSELMSPGCVSSPRYHRRVAMRWQDVGENACDIPHFSMLHGTGEVEDVQIADDGPYRRLCMNTPLSGEGDKVDCFWTTEHHGPGLIINRVQVAEVSLLNLTTISPIDSEEVHYRMSWSPTPDRRTSRRDYLVTRLFIQRMMSNSDQDIRIFENKICRQHPRVVPEDSNVFGYRRWVSQFRDQTTRSPHDPVHA